MQSHSRYDKNYRSLEFDIKNEFFDFISLFNIYKKYVKPTHSVIEVGASTRSRTKYLSTYCNRLTAVEYFPDRVLSDFDNVHYIQGDWQTLSKSVKTQFDILVSSQCLEHVANDLAAINETYKILKKGGIAIINTPNRKRLTRTAIELITGPRRFPFWEHFREYTKSDLINLINKSKFKRYEIRPISFGVSPKRLLSLKNCPKTLERLCIHWQITLYK